MVIHRQHLSLSSEDKVKLQKIWDTDYSTITTGKDNGVPFLTYVFDLHYKVFGETCTFCPGKINGYIKNLKNLNKENIMETSNKKTGEFQFHNMATFPFSGTSEVYSNANLTDEIAVEILAGNKNRKVLFAKMPKNVDELIDAFKKKEPAKKVVKVTTDDNKDAVGEIKFGERHITIELAKATLKKIGVPTRSSAAKGVQAAVDALVDAAREKFEAEMAVNIPVVAPVMEVVKDDEAKKGQEVTLEKLQFDLELAQQELEDLEAVSKDEEKLQPAREKVKELITKIENFGK